MELPVAKLKAEAVLPSRAHEGDAGLDLCSAIDVVVGPGERGYNSAPRLAIAVAPTGGRDG